MGDRGGNALLRVQDPVRASSYFGFRSVLTVTPGKYLRAKIGEDRDVWTSEKKCGQYVLLHKALHQQKPDGTSSKHSARLAGLCASCSGAVARWLVFTGPNLRLRGARLFQIEYRDRDYQTHVYFWNNPAALRKRRRNAKPLCVWRQSLRRRYSYGAFLEKHEKLDDAIAQYRQALQIDPRFVDAHIDLASELFANGELQEAKAHYLEATRLDPKLAQPHNYLGKIFMREGNAPQAAAQFEQALRLHPDFLEAEENLRLAKAGDPQFPSQSPQ